MDLGYMCFSFSTQNQKGPDPPLSKLNRVYMTRRSKRENSLTEKRWRKERVKQLFPTHGSGKIPVSERFLEFP